MYNGVLTLLLSEAWFFGCTSLITYAVWVLVGFHLFVILYEEPTLTAQFNGSYHSITGACGAARGGFTILPHQGRDRERLQYVPAADAGR